MLGGSNCKIDGGKKKMRKSSGKKKPAKKVKRKGGGLCAGNLAEFETAFGDSTANSSAPVAAMPTPVPSTMTGEMNGGAKKKRKSRKAGPYAKFVKKHFASVQKKNPKFKATDCMKEIAKMWKAQKK